MRWKCLALRGTVGRSATDSTQSARAASFRGYHTIARSWSAAVLSAAFRTGRAGFQTPSPASTNLGFKCKNARIHVGPNSQRRSKGTAAVSQGGFIQDPRRSDLRIAGSPLPGNHRSGRQAPLAVLSKGMFGVHDLRDCPPILTAVNAMGDTRSRR